MCAYLLNKSLSRQGRRVERISFKAGYLPVFLFLWFGLTGFRQADYEQAKKLAQQKKWAEAAVIYRSLLGESTQIEGTEQLELVFEFTRVLTLGGRREEALSLLSQKVNRVKGVHKTVVLRRLQVLSKMFLSESTSKIYQEGLQFLEARKFSDAVSRFESDYAVEPDNIEILVRLGQSYLLKKEYDKAVEKLRIARRLNSFEPEVRLWLGQALHQRGETKESLEELSLAKKELVQSELAGVWYAEALYSSGQKNLALSLLEKQVKAKPLQVLAIITLSRMRLTGAMQTDSATLWSVRKDLQLALSRVEEYEPGKGERFEGALGVDLRNSKLTKEEIVSLLERVENRLEGKPPAPEKSPKEIDLSEEPKENQ